MVAVDGELDLEDDSRRTTLSSLPTRASAARRRSVRAAHSNLPHQPIDEVRLRVIAGRQSPSRDIDA